jgi:hypothetical protein
VPGSHPDDDLPACRSRRRTDRATQLVVESQRADRQPHRVGEELPGEEVHRRRADEADDEEVQRARVQLARRTHLLELSAAHHGDAVAEPQRFG